LEKEDWRNTGGERKTDDKATYRNKPGQETTIAFGGNLSETHQDVGAKSDCRECSRGIKKGDGTQ